MKSVIVFLFLGWIAFAQSGENPNNSILSVLTTITEQKDPVLPPMTFDPLWVDSLQLILPCEGIGVPKRAMRLPNAPRDYRSGTHRGIDFFANWGTDVRAVAEGIVIRADHGYEEVPADFRENLLEASAKVGNTPSDIFNSVLLGQAVFLDHGFDLVPGFRTITIYAHLSDIKEGIRAGTQVRAGELLGRSGNTGMKESTLGSKAGSHLHWEMILQKGQQEIYLGRDVPNPELYNMLNQIFKTSLLKSL